MKHDGSPVECDATVSKLGADCLVMVVREKVAGHEAEEELAFAKAARERRRQPKLLLKIQLEFERG